MWLAHTQLLDSALPIGAFAQSFGLETLVQRGQVGSPQELQEYLETMLQHSWAPCDALAVKAVYVYAPEGQWRDVWRLDQMLHVQRAAREARDGMHKMGKGLLRLGRQIYPDLPWTPFLGAVAEGHCVGAYPTVYGWMSYHLQVPLPLAAEGYLYNCVVACLNNAVRLIALGQTRAQVLLAAMLPKISVAWLQVAERDPFDFSSGVPAAEIAMMQHESLYSRLFMS